MLPWDPDRQAMAVATVREEMDEFVAAVAACGHEAICINAEEDTERLISSLRLYQPDVVFNLIEFFHNDETLEVGVTGLYELFGLAYTGSRPQTLSICQRKDHTKLLLLSAGLPTSPYFVISHSESSIPDPDRLGLEYPLIVKPALEDASGGIDDHAVVSDYDSLSARVRHVLEEFDQPVLVERYIEGREIHVAIMGNEDPEVLPLLEMKFDDSEFYDDDVWRPRIISYDAKWDPLSKAFYCLEPVCPAEDVDPELERYIGEIALRAYYITGCRDYARIDLRVAENGEAYILEVNPNPDLADGSAFIMCATASGRTYARTLGEIIEMAAERAAGDEETDLSEDRPTDHLTRKYWSPKPPEKPPG